MCSVLHLSVRTFDLGGVQYRFVGHGLRDGLGIGVAILALAAAFTTFAALIAFRTLTAFLAVALGLGSCVELFAIQRGFCHLGLAVVAALVAFATAAVAALGAVLALLLLGTLVALLLITALGIAAVVAVTAFAAIALRAVAVAALVAVTATAIAVTATAFASAAVAAAFTGGRGGSLGHGSGRCHGSRRAKAEQVLEPGKEALLAHHWAGCSGSRRRSSSGSARLAGGARLGNRRGSIGQHSLDDGSLLVGRLL